MKKIIIIITALVLAVIVIAFGVYKFGPANNNVSVQEGIKIQPEVGFKDASYLIDGELITLKDGLSELEIEPGSAFKKITRYFGNDVKGDLNGDGKEDIAFLLTQDEGGSGTFYYLAVALADGNGYKGINTVLLGDRIAPQTTEIADGKITVNYADRKIDEPMSADPSVGVSKFFKVDNGNLIGVKNILAITNREWKWVSTKMSDGKVITPKKADAFMIMLKEDSSVNGKTDCNSFFGKYEMAGSKLSFGAMGSTKMFCEGSQEGDFLKSLSEVEGYLVDGEKNLVLQTKLGSSTMLFK